MELVFIDSEPPDAAGGGIRTYIRLALGICREAGIPARIYTHNPAAFPGEAAFPIGRRPFLRRPFRGLAYRLFYDENTLWEHACWLEHELAADQVPGRAIEFADFQGYGFFTLRNADLRPHCQVRVHTPAFLVPSAPRGLRARLAKSISAWRERECLHLAPLLAAPSAEFIREKLPWLRGWEHIPNPTPIERHAPGAALEAREAQQRAFRAALVSAGEPPASGDEAWSAATLDPLAAAAEARASAPPTRIVPARFLYLGRVEERKGVLVLLRAFARLAAERPLASLTLVGPAGDAAYSAAVRTFLESRPAGIGVRITWEPPAPPEGRAALFARFTALVVPSLWENSPYVYFEGMAAGLPCIGSATGEMRAVALATGAPNPAAGDEEAWLAALLAHCDGGDDGLPQRQLDYLSSRTVSVRAMLLAAWRRSAGEAA